MNNLEVSLIYIIMITASLNELIKVLQCKKYLESLEYINIKLGHDALQEFYEISLGEKDMQEFITSVTNILKILSNISNETNIFEEFKNMSSLERLIKDECKDYKQRR